MKIYIFYVEDDRYRVRTLLTGEFSHDAQALAHIEDLFDQSDHYQAIEMWDGERKVRITRSPEDGRADNPRNDPSPV